MKSALLVLLVLLLSNLLSAQGLNANDENQWPYNPILQPAPTPGKWVADPGLEKSWHLQQIRALQAWNISMGNHGSTIAVIDSGIHYNHEELSANLKRKQIEWPANKIDDDGNGYIDDVIGWDYINGKGLPWDRTGHGTFVAALAAAVEGNGSYSAGVCPKCSILPIRYINNEGFGDTEDAISGINYATKEKVAVMNLSFAGEGYDKDLHESLKRALDADIVVVASAGNDGMSNDKQAIYPANFQLPNLITVAAVDEEDVLTERSNWSFKKVHIAAPGWKLYGPWIDGTPWEKGEGTSFSAPLVSGAAALVRAVNPSLKATEVVSIILKTARKTPSLRRKVASEGVLDVEAAVRCAISKDLYCLGK